MYVKSKIASQENHLNLICYKLKGKYGLSSDCSNLKLEQVQGRTKLLKN